MDERRLKSGIYQIVNTTNRHRYIGSSSNLTKRLTEHKRQLTNNIHASKKLQFSFDKHGVDCFVFEIIEFCKGEKLLEREQYYLDTYKKYGLYNYQSRAASPAKGYKHTNEAKERIGNRWRGVKRGPRTEEHRDKLSNSLKGRKAWNKKEWPIRTCFVCSKQFSVKPHKVKDGKGKFCSVICKSIFQTVEWKSAA